MILKSPIKLICTMYIHNPISLTWVLKATSRTICFRIFASNYTLIDCLISSYHSTVFWFSQYDGLVKIGPQFFFIKRGGGARYISYEVHSHFNNSDNQKTMEQEDDIKAILTVVVVTKQIGLQKTY